MRVIKGDIYITGKGFCPGEVHIEDGKISKIICGEAVSENDIPKNDVINKDKFKNSAKSVNFQNKYRILPGLIDIHVHGANGYDFCDGTVESVEAIDAYENQNGIVIFCGATMTLDQGSIEKICEASKEAIDNGRVRSFCGMYLEGPFISANKAGAQNKDYLKLPDRKFVDMLNEISGDCIKYVVVAPELPGAFEMIESLKDKGYRISLGHSEADYETAVKAVECGARHVTHLYNAMTELNHRNPGIAGLALDDNRVEAELIADGIHVHPAVVRMTFDAKASGKIILISDSTMATGLEDGMYHLGDKEIIVKDKCSLLGDGTIAGGAKNLFECMVSAINMGVDYVKAIDAATINPARSLGIDDMYGSIEVGKSGRLVITDENYNIVEVL